MAERVRPATGTSRRRLPATIAAAAQKMLVLRQALGKLHRCFALRTGTCFIDNCICVVLMRPRCKYARQPQQGGVRSSARWRVVSSVRHAATYRQRRSRMTRFVVRCGWVLPTVARAAEIELAFKSDLPPPPCLLHHDFKRKQPGSGGGAGIATESELKDSQIK